MDPFDRLSFAQRLGQTVQAVANHAEDAFYAGLDKRFGDEIRYVFDLHD
jgi:hypothetical protein